MPVKKKFATLQTCHWKEELTPENNGAFFDHLQWALLLALRERGRLDVTEYRHAEETLRCRRIRQAAEALEQGGDLPSR